MKKLVMICVMAAMCFGSAGVAQAVRPILHPMMVSAQPFVSMSIKPGKLDLGTVPLVGFGSRPARLEAHIVANCPYQVKASVTPFRRARGHASIKPEHTNVEINGVNVPVAGSGVRIISSAKPTPPAGVDVPVEIRFSLGSILPYPAGPYKGNLILTITTRP